MNDTLLIGNKNGKTCGYDANDANKEIVETLIGRALRNEQYKVHGWNEKQSKLNGGFTVQKYSSHLDGSFQRMAIQFEFGRKLRDDRAAAVEDISLGICDVLKQKQASVS